MLRYRVCILALSLTLAISAPAAAQGRFGIGAFGGVFFATSDLIDQVAEGIGILDQKTGGGFGGRLGWWPLDRLGIEAEGGLAISKVRVRVPGEPEGSDNASVYFGSVNLLYAIVKPPLEPLSVYVSGGFGLVGRSGDAWSDDIINFQGLTDPAGVVGFGIRYGIARGLNLSADIRDYISSFKLEVEGIDQSLLPDAKLQNDLLITVGAEYTFGGV
ncbi:MAG: outer membrane beta-barrel protein [Gemmatimonadota bacterium]|nr:MAG: outer membrane beta-barrel protein [Gemmatimonadota bacterium]